MQSNVALLVTLTSLALVSAIYYCNILSGPRSWLRSEMLGMILLSLLTGLLPLALAAPVFLAWRLATEGLGANVLATTGAGLVSLLALIATILIFRALVIATYRIAGRSTRPEQPPHPTTWQPSDRARRKAA